MRMRFIACVISLAVLIATLANVSLTIPASTQNNDCGTSSIRTWVVNQNHPLANDDRAGTENKPFKTISRAAELAQPGDTIVVHEGVYRERVAPARGGTESCPITYTTAPGGTVTIKASEVWKPRWKPIKNHPNVYLGKLRSDLFSKYNPYKQILNRAPIAGMTLGQLFVDSEPLLEVGDRHNLFARPGTWMVAKDAESIWVHFTPSSKSLEDLLVELTVRERNFAPYKRGLGYITVRGFIMEHAGNQLPVGFWSSDYPQAGALGCRGGHHWVIENNIIRWAKTVGIDCGSEGRQDADGLDQPQPENTGYHIIRNNLITDNGAAGIVGIRSYGTQIISNIIERNGRLGLSGSETAGIKLHFFIGGLIEGNLIRNNGASAIWLDNVWRDSRVTRNLLLGNIGSGLFIEMGTGPLLVDNNIIALNTALLGLSGDGVYSHDASGVTLAHNLICFNANFGIWSHIGTDRKVTVNDAGDREIVAASDWRILNNIIIGNHRGAISLPFPSQRSRDNVSDYNLITSSFNLMTSETYSRELDKPIFLFNTNKGRVALDNLTEQFRKVLTQAKVPSAKRPNLKTWREQPLLNFDQWQLLTGHDTHSIVPKIIRPNISISVPFVSFIIDNSPTKLNCKMVEGVTTDFFDNPIVAERVMPGPFQQLKFEPALADRSSVEPYRGPYSKLKTSDRLNTFILWPLRARTSIQ